MLFLAAADRALLCTLTMFPFVDVHHSSDDPARFCNVESIQDNFRYPAVDLRAANGYYYYLGRCIYQRWYDPRRYGFSSIGSPNAILDNTATDSFLFFSVCRPGLQLQILRLLIEHGTPGDISSDSAIRTRGYTVDSRRHPTLEAVG